MWRIVIKNVGKGRYWIFPIDIDIIFLKQGCRTVFISKNPAEDASVDSDVCKTDAKGGNEYVTFKYRW